MYMLFVVADSVEELASALEIARPMSDIHFFVFSFFTPITDPGWGFITTPWSAWVEIPRVITQ